MQNQMSKDQNIFDEKEIREKIGNLLTNYTVYYEVIIK